MKANSVPKNMVDTRNVCNGPYDNTSHLQLAALAVCLESETRSLCHFGRRSCWSCRPAERLKSVQQESSRVDSTASRRAPERLRGSTNRRSLRLNSDGRRGSVYGRIGIQRKSKGSRTRFPMSPPNIDRLTINPK